MKNVTVSTEFFYKIKPYLDGLVFYREVKSGIELKFIPRSVKYIPLQLLTLLKNIS
jgi:hypothetical protein